MIIRQEILKRFALPCAALLAILPAQILPGAEPGLRGEVVANSFLFNYTGGLGSGRPHYLERYDFRKGWGSDKESGFYPDMSLDLIYSDGSRNLFALERRGDGLYNHAGRVRFNADQVGFSSYYSHYRSATGSIDYLYTPNQVPSGTGIQEYGTGNHQAMYRVFNDQGGNKFDYAVDRTTYGGSILFKEALLGDRGSVALNYNGYARDGSRFATFVAGGSDFAPSGATRWQGYDNAIHEHMNRVSFNITLSQSSLFHLAYEGSLEKFKNQVNAFTFDEYALSHFDPLSHIVTAGNGDKLLHFTPDATLLTHAFRLTGNSRNTAWNAGYANAILEQDTFTGRQIERGYTKGQISTDNGYLTINHRINPNLRLEGRAAYQKRDNDSSFPVAGLIETTNRERIGVRINQIETWRYGLSATYRSTGMKTTFMPGWRHVNKDRDLTFNNTNVTDGIRAGVSLYSEKTKSNELYLNIVSRPTRAVTLRLTPSYTWANQTGLVSEPEKSFKIKTQGSYAATRGLLVSGYYNFENRENGNHTFTDKAAPLATHSQDIDQAMHAAGLSLSMASGPRFSAFASLDWTQNAFESMYFLTNVRRFETATIFTPTDRSKYDVDTYHLSIGADMLVSDPFKLSTSYTYSKSKGDVASGTVGAELAATIDGTIDNILHTFALNADYAMRSGIDFRIGYIYDYYRDKEYRDINGRLLSGGVHMVTAGLVFKL